MRLSTAIAEHRTRQAPCVEPEQNQGALALQSISPQKGHVGALLDGEACAASSPEASPIELIHDMLGASWKVRGHS